MEFCPHGARIVVEDGQPVVLVDDCPSCSALLADIPAQAAVVDNRGRVAA